MQSDDEKPTSSESRRSSGSTASRADDADDYMGSSTSTAGPPPDSNVHTGRFTRPQWSLATGKLQDNERDSDESSCSTHTLKINSANGHRAGGGPDDSITERRHKRGSNSRTLSNTSVSVSPARSSTPKEWGRSFRLFNTSRFLPGASQSRPRDGSMSYMYRSTFMHPRHGRGSSVGLDNERPMLNTSISHQPQSSVFGIFGGQGGRTTFWPPENSVSGMLTAASTFGVNTGVSGLTGSPLLGSSRHASTAFVSRTANVRHSVHRAVASCAMGSVVCTLSQAQTKLSVAMNTLRAFISLCGETIIRGDREHPMEIKKGLLIGAGGFAKVYAGVNTVSGELVAIKEIDISGVEDITALNEIEGEFALLKSLHHPNIVSYALFEHSKSQQVCRIVMELLAGDSTLHLLQKFGPLTEAVLRIMTRNILRAIRFLHGEGIFHRDIKTANILVSHRGEVKLCDFGCSKRVTELNKAASCIIGTPVYMAPEFIKGEADHKADIWSLACALFELSTGLVPWYHTGVKDNIPLMFYITTTGDSPMVFPTPEARGEFSAEFLNFMDLCFTRNVANRPEAEELLKHPWIMGTRLPVVVIPPNAFLNLHQDNFFGLRGFSSPGKSSTFSSPRDSAVERDDASLNESDALQKSVSFSPTLNPAEEEVACQQELEGVAAATALDLCAALVCPLDMSVRVSQEPGPLEMGSGTGDTSPSLTRTLSILSPALSHRGPVSVSLGEFPSPVFTPEHSMVHENFYYNQVSLGASGGNFVLPLGLDLDGAPPLQQYLRINEEGNLDLVHLPEDELEDSTRPGRVISPARSGSFSRNSLSPRFAAGITALGGTDRAFSPLLAPSGTFSRGESPSRGGTSVPPSPQGIPAPPLLYRPASLSTTTTAVAAISHESSHDGSPHMSPTSTSKADSNRDAATPRSDSSASIHRSGSFSGLPEKLRPQADGRLHMSFSVSTAPGHPVNVELNVDVADVQCKVVDNQPNFVVAFTDDVRNQIIHRIKEVSVLSTSTSTTPLYAVGHNSPASTSGGPDGHGAAVGNHFYSGPSFASSSSSRPLPRPLSRMSSSSAARLLSAPRDGNVDSRSASGEMSSTTNSRASSPAANGSSAHLSRQYEGRIASIPPL
ncbi:protein kinase putativeserine/threonine protein kinase putative (MRK1) [Leptomonas pyrrhocoris]|uniref:Protein kinase putativeserine/threonine protein kinase putative (MRK1) n=1 Tax=Leptomonas pyrrhocoris TaxID=157538 RepID=A0A0N0DYU3_LEPPY|nr:protein kinase putativeserine/threonine protein kinase putative (MRK1) [Leptomonas pyrrhocoris]XP_015662931.1 protein kinase putativeserine/threonine protein kinase putative (MRK1) [Leptomonas pyrrhocoris]KPA84491.1 protein kinase putativeserine/threonine protein kinase putative (MRK1) [Leptomonas pyrrhocoris]KPA84492.1 protein kinase putativeserine/threonine protein kinase putative (MRK1) [Leptomonas pyrrhocoris]|eukprot:XP_015662930.1 protein kinase putativeserine/threonine protein kinase putative (MRK1) [Leptomonas pyrrhocoris]